MQAQVLSTVASRSLGHFKFAFVHPETGQFIAFILGISGAATPADIQKWGKAQILVDMQRPTPPFEIVRLKQFGPKRCLINNKTVLSKSGRKLGSVSDFSLDTQTNRLVAIHPTKSFLFWEWDMRTFTYEQIDHISERSIHLNIEPEAKVKAGTKRAFWRRLSLRSI